MLSATSFIVFMVSCLPLFMVYRLLTVPLVMTKNGPMVHLYPCIYIYINLSAYRAMPSWLTQIVIARNVWSPAVSPAKKSETCLQSNVENWKSNVYIYIIHYNSIHVIMYNYKKIKTLIYIPNYIYTFKSIQTELRGVECSPPFAGNRKKLWTCLFLPCNFKQPSKLSLFGYCNES